MLPSQVEAAKFLPPRHLHPHPKNTRPFHTWAIDLITNLTPPGPRGEVHAVVCVCAFSKWVEIGPLADRTSSTVASWFHREITCRFGTPSIVRCNRGKEFEGEFAEYLRSMGVERRAVFTAHPRANG